MKQLKYISFGIVFALSALTVLGKNNFTKGFGFFEEEQITQQQVHNLVNQRVIEPLTTCYLKANPDALMMKCMVYIKFKFSGWRGEEMDENTTFGPSERIDGVIVLDDCGAESHICSLQLVYASSEIRLRESYFQDWGPAADFVKTFCERISSGKTD